MILVGTSGFAYKEWKGSFYPDKIANTDMLAFYARHFSTVEINNTFYRMPKAELLAGWKEQVPPSFRFVLKAPQRITHIKRLKDVEGDVAHFTDVALSLGEQLGALLFQLPPNFKVDLPRLQALLTTVGRRARVALEFRNPTWLTTEVYAALRAHDAALCIADTDDNQTPFEVTASFGYARLRGTSYSPDDIGAWAKKLRSAPWQDALVFFKHEDEGTGPLFGRILQERLAAG